MTAWQVGVGTFIVTAAYLAWVGSGEFRDELIRIGMSEGPRLQRFRPAVRRLIMIAVLLLIDLLFAGIVGAICFAVALAAGFGDL